MLGRVLTEDLVERLPGAAVFSESGAISTRPDLVLEIDVQRFDTDATGTLVLLAQVAVRRVGRARGGACRDAAADRAPGLAGDPRPGGGDECRAGRTRRPDRRDAGARLRRRGPAGQAAGCSAATSRSLRAIAAMPLPRLVESASINPSCFKKSGPVAAISAGLRPE